MQEWVYLQYLKIAFDLGHWIVRNPIVEVTRRGMNLIWLLSSHIFVFEVILESIVDFQLSFRLVKLDHQNFLKWTLNKFI